jgi:phenylalanyl-tRNA synthetase beta subunit
MVELGFDEVISSSCVKVKFNSLNKHLWNQKELPVRIINPPSPDFMFLRSSLLPNLYEFTKRIINERGIISNLFEIGKIYHKQANQYQEKRVLGIIYWKQGENYTSFKAAIEALMEKMNIFEFSFETFDCAFDRFTNTFCIKAVKNKDIIALGGEIDNCYYLEIDLDQILNKSSAQTVKLWPAYPPQIKSYTIVIPLRTQVGKIINKILETSKEINNISYIGDFKGAYTFTITYQSNQRTLTNSDVEIISREWLKDIKTKFNVELK